MAYRRLNTVRCCKCGYSFLDRHVLRCPHPGVNKKLGSRICVYCCRGCKFRAGAKWLHGAVICTYGKEVSNVID